MIRRSSIAALLLFAAVLMTGCAGKAAPYSLPTPAGPAPRPSAPASRVGDLVRRRAEAGGHARGGHLDHRAGRRAALAGVVEELFEKLDLGLAVQLAKGRQPTIGFLDTHGASQQPLPPGIGGHGVADGFHPVHHAANLQFLCAGTFHHGRNPDVAGEVVGLQCLDVAGSDQFADERAQTSFGHVQQPPRPRGVVVEQRAFLEAEQSPPLWQATPPGLQALEHLFGPRQFVLAIQIMIQRAQGSLEHPHAAVSSVEHGDKRVRHIRVADTNSVHVVLALSHDLKFSSITAFTYQEHYLISYTY